MGTSSRAREEGHANGGDGSPDCRPRPTIVITPPCLELIAGKARYRAAARGFSMCQPSHLASAAPPNGLILARVGVVGSRARLPMRFAMPLQPSTTAGNRYGDCAAAAAACHCRDQSRQKRALDHEQTGHRSVSVVRRYIRDAELFDDNAAAGIGL